MHERIYLFDEIRGFMIINVILYHLIYDLVFFYNQNIPWFVGPVGDAWQEVICGTFILISGACSYYSQSNIWRGLRLLGFAYLISLVTYYMMPDYMIKFGILHMLGVSMILFAIVKNQLIKFPNVVGFLFFAVLFIFTFKTSQGYWGFPLFKLTLPEFLYKSDSLFMLGFYSSSFNSSDYFPLLPYVFLFFSGSFIGKAIQRGSWPDWFYQPHSRLWAAVGGKSLWLYLLHQPVLFAIFWLLF